MSAIRLGLLGATGRMGRAIQDLLRQDASLGKEFTLAWTSSGREASDLATLNGAQVDVLVDFSSTESSLRAAERCASEKIPMLVCVTGFPEKDRAKLENLLKGRAWALVPNTSFGVHALRQALRAALAALPAEFRAEMREVHHAQKRDKPSGTAKSLNEEIRRVRGTDAPVESVREGDAIGLHTITLRGPGERLELTHEALDRALFARGALRLARRLTELARSSTSAPYPAELLFV